MKHVAPEHKTGSDRAAATASAKPLLWTIRNKRYAVPESFVARHPGGVDAITLGRGRNCTELFESYHSLSDKPDALLAAWFVEDARPGDADFDTTFDWDGDRARFYAELKREARAFFAGRSHKADWFKAGPLFSLFHLFSSSLFCSLFTLLSSSLLLPLAVG